MKDEVACYKEVRLLQPLRITLMLAGLAEDGSRFSIRNEIWREDGKLMARVTSTGGQKRHPLSASTAMTANG
jgi:acyl-CoA thioester hydrolase